MGASSTQRLIGGGSRVLFDLSLPDSGGQEDPASRNPPVRSF
jgi:hypothetical protein